MSAPADSGLIAMPSPALDTVVGLRVKTESHYIIGRRYNLYQSTAASDSQGLIIMIFLGIE